MMGGSITTRHVLKYTLLPGILPRFRTLFGTGFGSLVYFVALVYRSVRLLPEGHPYLNPANIGRYGLFSVISEAARHIHFNRYQLRQNNYDQIIVFVTILIGLFILLIQFASLAIAITMPQAMAFTIGTLTFVNPFDMMMPPPNTVLSGSGLTQPQPFYDVAFIFLDRVFGVPNMFSSCISDVTANNCVSIGPSYGADAGITVNDPGPVPWPYHMALHAIFSFYSTGLLVVAVFLLIYYAFVVVAETAQTGVPFGKRFNTLWAPLRLVMAAGMLVPIGFGLNAGQYIVLYAAKWGSNFATNGWIGFNSIIFEGTIAGQTNELLAKPKTPEFVDLANFFSLAHACRMIENQHLLKTDVKFGYAPPTSVTPAIDDLPIVNEVKMYQVRTLGAGGLAVAREINMTDAFTYPKVVEWARYGDVVIRFGIYNPFKYYNERGFVFPLCGEVTMKTVINPKAIAAPAAAAGPPPAAPATPKPAYYFQGATKVQSDYWDLVRTMWNTTTPNTAYTSTVDSSITVIPNNISDGVSSRFYTNFFNRGCAITAAVSGCLPPALPTDAERTQIITYLTDRAKVMIAEAKAAETTTYGSGGATGTPENPAYSLPPELKARGWAAAGLWYNRIAEMNGAFAGGARNVPLVTRFPFTMEYVAKQKRSTNSNVPPDKIFDPHTVNQSYPIKYLRGDSEGYAADTYSKIYDWWGQSQVSLGSSTRAAKTGNIIIDVINLMFGTEGLYSIRENPNVHPLAQLSSIGKTMVERAVFLMGLGTGSVLLTGLTGEKSSEKVLGLIGNFAFSILAIGATGGFILYYIIPFLPFIYFFFAVAGWVKAIFEAMVGVPLWALAHIRIDGHGLPGDAATTGYFLIFEIFLRPILIIFGLLASVSLFSASVQVLNDIFDVAVANVSGFDMSGASAATPPAGMLENMRGAVDSFFFTVLYVLLVYMLGQSCFKLIDLIPGSMLRWMGSSAQPFSDSGDSAANQLMSYGTIGGNMVFGQVAGAVKSGATGVSDITASIRDKATPRN